MILRSPATSLSELRAYGAERARAVGKTSADVPAAVKRVISDRDPGKVARAHGAVARVVKDREHRSKR